MEVIAKLKFLRMAPRKVRLVANLIKGLNIEQAKAQLKFLSKRATDPVSKTLNSAVANAENNFHLQRDNLYISKIFVDGGPMLKRWMPRAMGRASAIQKKTSHLTVILAEMTELKGNKTRKIEKETVISDNEGQIESASVEQKKIEGDKLRKAFKTAKKAEVKKVVPKGAEGIRKVFRRKTV